MLYYDTTCVGHSPQDNSAINYKEISWENQAYNIIKFTKEKPTGDLLRWLQEDGIIKGPNTFQGLFNYVNNQDNETLKKAKTYINDVMNNYHAPIASENTLGIVMGGGTGIDIDEMVDYMQQEKLQLMQISYGLRQQKNLLLQKQSAKMQCVELL